MGNTQGTLASAMRTVEWRFQPRWGARTAQQRWRQRVLIGQINAFVFRERAQKSRHKGYVLDNHCTPVRWERTRSSHHSQHGNANGQQQPAASGNQARLQESQAESMAAGSRKKEAKESNEADTRLVKDHDGRRQTLDLGKVEAVARRVHNLDSAQRDQGQTHRITGESMQSAQARGRR